MSPKVLRTEPKRKKRKKRLSVEWKPNDQREEQNGPMMPPPGGFSSLKITHGAIATQQRIWIDDYNNDGEENKSAISARTDLCVWKMICYYGKMKILVKLVDIQ